MFFFIYVFQTKISFKKIKLIFYAKNQHFLFKSRPKDILIKFPKYHFFENLSTSFLVMKKNRLKFTSCWLQLHICGHTSRLFFWRLKSTTPTKELSRSKDNLSSCQRKRGPINETKGDQKSPNQVFPLPYFYCLHLTEF